MAIPAEERVARDFRHLMARICPVCARAMRSHAEAREIAPKELCAALAGGREIVLLDVRHPLDTLGDARVIPGAQRFRPQELAWGRLPFRREQPIVAYCAMPQQAGSRHAARLLRKRGFTGVQVLRGGFAAWRDFGFPLARYQAADEQAKQEQRQACRRS